jgi:hypothetical protein
MDVGSRCACSNLILLVQGVAQALGMCALLEALWLRGGMLLPQHPSGYVTYIPCGIGAGRAWKLWQDHGGQGARRRPRLHHIFIILL